MGVYRVVLLPLCEFKVWKWFDSLRNSGNKSLQSHDIFHTWMKARVRFRVINLWRMFWDPDSPSGRWNAALAGCWRWICSLLWPRTAGLHFLGGCEQWESPRIGYRGDRTPSAADYPVALATQDIRHTDGWMDGWIAGCMDRNENASVAWGDARKIVCHTRAHEHLSKQAYVHTVSSFVPTGTCFFKVLNK